MTETLSEALKFPFELYPAHELSKNVGLIVLAPDEVGAQAFTKIMSDYDLRLFVTRARYSDESNNFELVGGFDSVAQTLPPSGSLDVLAFNCTSATVQLGAERMLSILSAIRPGIQYTTPGIGGLAALEYLQVRKISILTPYRMEVHRLFAPFFNKNGFEVVREGTFDMLSDRDMCNLTRDSIFGAAKRMVEQSQAEALFISCTSVPVVDWIAELEDHIGVPVVTSTQAEAWHTLKLLDLDTSRSAKFGKLFGQGKISSVGAEVPPLRMGKMF